MTDPRRVPGTNTFTTAIGDTAECIAEIANYTRPFYEDLVAATTMPGTTGVTESWVVAAGRAWFATLYGGSKLAEQTVDNLVLIATSEASMWATSPQFYTEYQTTGPDTIAPTQVSLFQGDQVLNGDGIAALGHRLDLYFEDRHRKKRPFVPAANLRAADWTGRFMAVIVYTGPDLATYIPGRLRFTLEAPANGGPLAPVECEVPVRPYRGELTWNLLI